MNIKNYFISVMEMQQYTYLAWSKYQWGVKNVLHKISANSLLANTAIDCRDFRTKVYDLLVGSRYLLTYYIIL